MPKELDQDEEQLRLLSLAHYASAALTALLALVPLGYSALVTRLVLREERVIPGRATPGLEALHWVALGLGVASFLLGLGLAGANLAVARCLTRRVHHKFCLVVAGFNCVVVPLGTLLGVFTLLVLSRTSVQRLFGEPHSPTGTTPNARFPSNPPPA